MNKIIAKFAFVATVACLVAFGGSLSARADYGSCMTACGNGIENCETSCSNLSPYDRGLCSNSCWATFYNCEANCHR